MDAIVASPIYVIDGIAGSHYRFASLQHCSANHQCNRESLDSVKASCLLAVTAVLLWSKVMYFLTPWMAAGKLGKYLALCVCLCFVVANVIICCSLDVEGYSLRYEVFPCDAVLFRDWVFTRVLVIAERFPSTK